MKKPSPEYSHTTEADSQEIFNDIRLLVQHIRLASRDSEASIGLSAAQLFVLRFVSEEDRLSVNDLAERTMTHQSSVSTVIQKLEAKRLVKRSVSDSDGRKFEFSLTKNGAAIMRKAPLPVQNILMDALDKMDPKVRKKFADCFSEFLNLADIHGEPPLLFADSATKKRKK
jgi:DNA-binding MarR family transcriptional regulator